MLFGTLLIAAATALAACNSNSGYQAYVAPTPGPTCSPGENVQMVYPIPGATGVPDNPQQIVFAVASPLPSSWNVFLNSTNSYAATAYSGYTAAGFETISASQVPAPSATPSISNPVYQSVTLISGFPADATRYVWVNNGATSCTPLGPVGSFTTQ